jgi:hypothetical protein
LSQDRREVVADEPAAESEGVGGESTIALLVADEVRDVLVVLVLALEQDEIDRRTLAHPDFSHRVGEP